MSRNLIPQFPAPVTTSAVYPCVDCGGGFDASQGYDLNGSFICQMCCDARTAAAAMAASSRSPPAARKRHAPMPEYGAIKLGAAVLETLAGLLLVACVIYLLLAATAQDMPVRTADAPVINGAMASVRALFLILALASFAWSAILFMLASLARAVRDMARNSFR